jgi:hypothetical protein
VTGERTTKAMGEVVTTDLLWLRRRADRRYTLLTGGPRSRDERIARALRVRAWLAQDEASARDRLRFFREQQANQQPTEDHHE